MQWARTMLAVYSKAAEWDFNEAEDLAAKAFDLAEQGHMQLARAAAIAEQLARFLEEDKPEL